MTTNLEISNAGSVVDRIKSRGYWRVRFVPLVERSVRFTLAECIGLVENANVTLRGWDFPHVSHEHEYTRGNDFVEFETDWGKYKLMWRMFQSGQFICYRGLREDWLDQEPPTPNVFRPAPGECLEIVMSLIYEVTEVFEFLSRLASKNAFGGEVNLAISLENTQGRRLWISSQDRVDFGRQYVCRVNRIDYNATLGNRETIENPAQNASKVIEHVYQRFGFDHYSKDQIRSTQKELYEMRGQIIR